MDELFVARVAVRIAQSRFGCKGRLMPCSACHNPLFDGCYALARASLAPLQAEAASVQAESGDESSRL